MLVMLSHHQQFPSQVDKWPGLLGGVCVTNGRRLEQALCEEWFAQERTKEQLEL
jgi:hypothetical protein